MKLEQKLTPPQLAALAFAGSFLLYAECWFADAILHAHHKHGEGDMLQLLDLMLRAFGPMILGLCATSMAQAALKRGLISQNWDEAVLEKLRIELDSLVWRWITVGLGLIGIGYDLFFLNSGHASSSGVFAMWPFITLQQLQKTLRPKREATFPVWCDYLKPIHSDHWGERNP